MEQLGNIDPKNISFHENEAEYEYGHKCVDVRINDNNSTISNGKPPSKPTMVLSMYGSWVQVISGDLAGGLDGCNITGWMPDEQTLRISLTRQMELGDGSIVSDTRSCVDSIVKFMAHLHDYVYANRIKLLANEPVTTRRN